MVKVIQHASMFRIERRRTGRTLVTGLVVAAMGALVVPALAEDANPMASFARMVSGEWKVTAQSGTSMLDTWHWGPGKHSMRVMTEGFGADGKPWRELQVYYWHPSRKQVCLLGLSPFASGVSEGTIKFEGETADAVIDLYQSGGRRKMGLHWAFDGPDKYHVTLLEATGPDGLMPLNEWDYVRSNTPRATRPHTDEEAPKLTKSLKVFESLLGHTWNTKGNWGAEVAFHIETTFEWVPLANAIYARTFALRGNGTPMHLLDTYFYHHTGTDRLRCLALSKWGDWQEAVNGVYEGDATLEEGGALQIDLNGYEGERGVSYRVQFDFEKDGTLHHRVWSPEGAERTPMLDVRHTASEMSRNILVVFQDKKNNYWFGSDVQGVYRYDGKAITHFTTKDGLCNNQIRGIQEDKSGNIYFATVNGISKFDGRTFSTLNPVRSNPPEKEWKLAPDDLWFLAPPNAGAVCRYDGTTLHGLELPKTTLAEEFISKHPRSQYPFFSNPDAVYTIYKDSKGNMWFGMGAAGVCRYDGKSFLWISEDDVTEYHNGPANGVRSIIEDKNGKFWFSNTLYHYDVYQNNSPDQRQDGQDNIAMAYRRVKGIGSLDGKKDGDCYEYMSAARDSNDALWIATWGAGVWRYDGTGIVHYPIMDGDNAITLYSIYKDNRGDLWLGTHEAGAYKFNGKTFEKFLDPKKDQLARSGSVETPKEALIDNSLDNASGAAEAPGRIGEPANLDPYFTPTEAKSTPYMPRVIIRNMREDRAGNIWFATFGGPIRYDGKEFTNFSEEVGLAQRRIFSLLEDRSGALWFGSITGGVSRYGGKSFTKFTEKEGLGNNDVTWIFEDRDGKIWFATGNGVSRYDGKSMTNFTTKDGLVHNSVYTIIQDASGRIWFGTQGGICSFDGKSFSNLADQVGRSFLNIRAMVVDRSGNLWCGGQEGAYRYDGKTVEAFTTNEGLLDDFVGSMIVDRAGNIWLGHPDGGGGGGASRYDGKSFTHFTQKDGLNSTNVYCMLEDKAGNIWFGSVDAGACRYDGKTFTDFSPSDATWLPGMGVTK